MHLIEFSEADIEELRAFFLEDAAQYNFALGVLEEQGLGKDSLVEACGWRSSGSIAGVVLVGGKGGLVLPCFRTVHEAAAFAKKLRGKYKVRSILGERSVVDSFHRALDCGFPKKSRIQKLFSASADDLGPFVCPGLRMASIFDYAKLVDLSLMAYREENGEIPASVENEIRRRVRARIEGERTFVLVEEQQVLVKIDIGVRSRQGAELEGIFTIPERRHRGNATLALGQLSRTLLSSIRRLSIRVDEHASALIKVCRKVGYLPLRPQRLLIF